MSLYIHCILSRLADANVVQVRDFLFSPMSATGAQNDANSELYSLHERGWQLTALSLSSPVILAANK